MLPDQANDLRKLVIHSVRGVTSPDVPPPKLVVVAGGKGGVGTTTVAVNLAAALAREGSRVVLVDADFAGPNVAELCGLDGAYGAADVLAGRRTVHEVLLRGPIGIQVLPANRTRVEAADCTPQAQDRLLAQLQSLGAHADYVIVDAGSGNGRAMRRFWDAADAVLLVVQPDSVAVMDAYTLVKLTCNENPPRAAVAVVVNGAEEPTIAADVCQRLDRACRRFLGLTVSSTSGIPSDPSVSQAASQRRPLMLQAPTSPAAAAFARLAEALPSLTSDAARPHVHFHRTTSSHAG
jgi:flagellar biosynthesis protein FlhG